MASKRCSVCDSYSKHLTTTSLRSPVITHSRTNAQTSSSISVTIGNVPHMSSTYASLPANTRYTNITSGTGPHSTRVSSSGHSLHRISEPNTDNIFDRSSRTYNELYGSTTGSDVPSRRHQSHSLSLAKYSNLAGHELGMSSSSSVLDKEFSHLSRVKAESTSPRHNNTSLDIAIDQNSSATAACNISAGMTTRERKKQNQTHLMRRRIEEKAPDPNGSSVFLASAANVHRETHPTSKGSALMFGCCELRLNLTQAIWEYIDKYHQDELRRINRSCELSVTQRSEGELCLKVKTSSYDDLVNRFQEFFGPLFEYLNAEITEIETELDRSEDGNQVKEELEKQMKCVAHLAKGGHLQVICKKADRLIVEKILRNSLLSSAKIDKVECLPAAGFEPTSYTVNGRIRLFLHMNDITSLNLDAIICPANPTLEVLGGLFKVISLAAGTDFEIECLNVIAMMGRNLKVGEVVNTRAGRLPAHYVLLVTGPNCPVNPTYEDLQDCYRALVDVFQNIIKYADGIRLRSIAIPPVSSGIYGVPSDVVAQASHEIINVLSETKHLEEIHFVDISEEFLLMLQNLFERDTKAGKLVQNSSGETLSWIMSVVHSPVSGRTSSYAQTAAGTSWDATDEISLSDRRRNEEETGRFGIDEPTPGSQLTTDSDFTEKCFLVNHSVKVILSKQDISQMHVDAIVNPTNGKMMRSKGISKLLETKAGSGYISDCQKCIAANGSLQMSEVALTGAGDLPCKMVFHAVTPVWLSSKKKQCISDLQATLRNVFFKAEEAKIRSIACPIIGGGTAGFPRDVIANVMVETLQKTLLPRSRLKEVYIVDIHGQILGIVYKVFHDRQNTELFNEVAGEVDIRHLSTNHSRDLVEDKTNKSSVKLSISRDVSQKEKRNSSENEKLLNPVDSLVGDKHQERHPKSKSVKISTEKQSVRSPTQSVVRSKHDSECAMDMHSLMTVELKERQQPDSSCKLLTDSSFTDKCFFVNRSVKVILSRQDISEMTVSAIIHPVNRRLQHTKRFDELLEKKAGSSYVAEYQKLLDVWSNPEVSEVQTTCPGDLPCGMVLHAVIPRWSSEKQKQDQCLVDLETTFCNVFTLTESSRLRTVAFPANTEGMADIPCSAVARNICDALLKTVNSESYLKKVYIVDLSDDILDNIYSVFHNHQEKGFFEELYNLPGTTDSQAADITKLTNEEGACGNYFDDGRDSLEPHSVKSHSMNGLNENKVKDASRFGASVNNADEELSLKTRQTPERSGTVRVLDSEEEQFIGLKEESQTLKHKNDETSPSNRHAESVASVKQADVRPKEKSLPSTDHDTEKAVPSKQQKYVENTLQSEDQKCMICFQTITEPKTLGCSHTFCQDCIQHMFSRYQPKCPCCGRLYGVCRGNQPDGKMKTEKLNCSLPGYEGHKTIVINYDIPGGIQGEDHPNPGHPYHGTHRTAYLPDNAEGREILALLKKAFDARLVFTVGHSVTSGAEDVVTWNDIHHKTSTHGGPTSYGYPDPSYLSRVRQELADKGIK